jgi:hypothetical protein
MEFIDPRRAVFDAGSNCALPRYVAVGEGRMGQRLSRNRHDPESRCRDQGNGAIRSLRTPAQHIVRQARAIGLL